MRSAIGTSETRQRSQGGLDERSRAALLDRCWHLAVTHESSTAARWAAGRLGNLAAWGDCGVSGLAVTTVADGFANHGRLLVLLLFPLVGKGREEPLRPTEDPGVTPLVLDSPFIDVVLL